MLKSTISCIKEAINLQSRILDILDARLGNNIILKYIISMSGAVALMQRTLCLTIYHVTFEYPDCC